MAANRSIAHDKGEFQSILNAQCCVYISLISITNDWKKIDAQMSQFDYYLNVTNGYCEFTLGDKTYDTFK